MTERLIQHADWQPHADYQRFLEGHIRRQLPPETELSGRFVRARVNHGRWIAECEDERCDHHAAVVLDLERPYFWCVGCMNFGEGWHGVIVPEPRLRAGIERELLRRPNRANRNWEPGESVADLRAENRLMGVA